MQTNYEQQHILLQEILKHNIDTIPYTSTVTLSDKECIGYSNIECNNSEAVSNSSD